MILNVEMLTQVQQVLDQGPWTLVIRANQRFATRETRHKRQQAGHRFRRKSVKSSGSDDASLSCGRNHGVSLRVGPSRSPKVSSTMSCDEQVEEAQREVPCLSRHEPVPLPKGQSASRPERFLTQPSPDCFSRPRASRSSSRGRGVGLVFLWCAPSSSSLFFRFSVLVSREFSRSRGCAVATSAIRGVSRGG